MLEQLLNEELWNEFLIRKTQNSHLPKKEREYFTEYITNKKYLPLASKIVEGNYTFSTPKKMIISKMGKAKKRIVYSFTEDETMILKFMAYLLYSYDYLFADNLYSFRKDSGVKKAVYTLTKKYNIKNMYAYKADVSNYFNSINTTKILSRLKNELNDEKLYNFFSSILSNTKCIYNNEEIEEQKGAMAGVPISAFLANFYLKDIDLYFKDKNVLYCRYADDIIIFANTLEEVQTLSLKLKELILENDLVINKDKEFYYNPGEEIEFLGFSFQNGTVDLSSNTIKKIKGKIHRSARGIRRWMLRKDETVEHAIKAMNRKFNHKFFGKENDDLTWKYWFFPCITTDESLKIVDEYMQENLRFMATGKYNKKNYEKMPYSKLKEYGYTSLVHEYYKFKEEKDNIK